MLKKKVQEYLSKFGGDAYYSEDGERALILNLVGTQLIAFEKDNDKDAIMVDKACIDVQKWEEME